MRSSRRNHGRQYSPAQEERAGRRCEWNGPEGDGAERGRPSTISRQARNSDAEAATERSEGVAGLERYQSPVNLP
ncbi:MAG TPA: hypothetical protein PLM60_04705 [Methanoregulaceae archaeon]|nr:hypothetical protein [Methanoregulaceae archaeon]HPS22690.1 hypothetical protein [Methanoregulaceae archaeon]